MPLMISQGNSHVFTQSTTPTGAVDGDLWIDTSTTPRTLKMNSSGTWKTIEDQTDNKAAASGYASLDSSSFVPATQLGNAVFRKDKVTTLASDGTALTASGLTAYDAYSIFAILKVNSANELLNITINNDTGSNYSAQTIAFLSTTVSASTTSAAANVALFSTANSSANDLIIIKGVIFNRKISANYHLGQLDISVQRSVVTSAAIQSFRTDFKHNQASDISRIDINSTVGNMLTGSILYVSGISLA